MVYLPRPSSDPESRSSAVPLVPASACVSAYRAKLVTVVVPTYHEFDNITALVARLDAVRRSAGLNLEVLLMDDDSRDGSAELVDSLAMPWVRLVTRTSERGLSASVLDGIRRSKGDYVVVMDADLSHPPEKIPDMLAALDGADMAIGSRFTAGGTIDDKWGPFRWLNSRVASLLARPLTTAKDPMSGFFAMRRSTFESGKAFNPVGYKIGLEFIVKCRCRRIAEVPIHFADRQHGESKLTMKEQLRYLQHLRRLYIYRYGTWSHFGQFALIGLSGVGVNLALLTVFLAAGVAGKLSIALAIALSMTWNFALNRRFSFSYARDRPIVRQFVGFVAACSLGAVINFLVTVAVWDAFNLKQIAATLGVLAGTVLNFMVNRFVVFRATDVARPRS